MVNGKKIELTEEQVKLLKEEPKKKSSWDKRGKEGEFYCIDEYLDVISLSDDGTSADINLYEIANYNTDKEFMKMKALEFKLSLLLTRFRDEHDDKPTWKDNGYKCYIFYNYSENNFEISGLAFNYRELSQVYFKTNEIAEKALETFKDEFYLLATYYEKY